MDQDSLNKILATLTVVMPLVILLINQFLQRRKNKIEYGDDLLEVTNKTVASLKQARLDLTALETELRTSDKEHVAEIAALEKAWKERQDRMKARILELEKVIVKYDVSFTLVTHPNVQVTNLQVVGKENVAESQKMRAVITQDQK